jgi:hypothetical protein
LKPIKKRAYILKQFYPGEIMVNNITFLLDEQTVDSMLIKLLKNYESIKIIEKCRSRFHEKVEKKPYTPVFGSEKNATDKLKKLLKFEIKCLYNSNRK